MNFFLDEDVSFMNSLSGFQEEEQPHHLTQQNDTSMTLLGADFAPNEHSVVCGRAKHFAQAPGNQRLKMLVEFYLKPYSQTTKKSNKSAIVSKIVDSIKAESPQGAFVKYEEGLW
jgi:hypothetical protein